MGRILVVDPSAEFARAVAGLLAPDLGATVQHLEALPSAAQLAGEAEPHVLVTGPDIGPEAALATVRQLAGQGSNTATVAVVNKVTTELLHEALRAGAHDVVASKDSAAELQRAITEAYWAAERRRPSGTTESHALRSAPLITVFSTKGGVGKSVLATNLGVALATMGKRAVLVDLDLQFGDVGIMLGLQPQHAITDAALAGDRLDEEMLKGFLTDHKSGLKVLLAPVRPEDAENVTNARVTRVLTLLQRMADIVVVDTAATFDETVLTALDRTSRVLAVSMMDVASIKNTRISLQKLQQLGYSETAVDLVLNRADSKVWLQPSEVERAVGAPVRYRIPSDRVVPRSVNKGTPVVLDEPRSDVARAMNAIARDVANSVEEVMNDVA